MFSSRQSQSKIFACGTAFLFCLAFNTISNAQAPGPAAHIEARSRVTAASRVPTVVHSALAGSNIPTAGAASDAHCLMYENTDVVVINNVMVEVHECDSTTMGTGGGSSGGSSGPAPGGVGDRDPAASATPTGNPTDPEDCQLFTAALNLSCSALPAADRASCQYNACAQGARCMSQPASQCGTKPKPTSHAGSAGCSNTYAANFNACTQKFRTAEGQNGCLYAAQQTLNACVAK